MKKMTIARAAGACGAEIYKEGADSPIRHVVIDSRQIQPGDLFVAYRGERVDGHDYVQTAFQKGAACCLVEHPVENAEGPQLVVKDVQEALEAICRDYRQEIDVPLIGITGSVGKTSAKEMIWAVLRQRMPVHKTEGNLNNQIGVPMTLSRLEEEHKAAVVEMGISGFGEMTALARMVKPQIAVFTIIGQAHLEFLENRQGVLRAKTEMLAEMDENALMIANGDDELLRAYSCPQRKILFGLGEHCDLCAVDVRPSGDGMACTIRGLGRCLQVEIPAFGQHMVYAALAGAAVGMELGLSDEEIIRGIAAYETVGRRAALSDTGFVTLLDDCYNANPDSVKCGVDSLGKLPGRKVCILGDMLELGPEEKALHFDCGVYAAEKGMDLVLGSGPLTEALCKGAGKKGKYFASREALIAALPGLLQKGDAVLVKASRGMHFEEVSEAVKKLGKPCVFLDADDTILDFHRSEAVAIRETFQELGIPVTDEIISRYSQINKKMWEKLEDGLLTRQQVLEYRFEELFRELGIPGSGYETQLLYEYRLSLSHFFMPQAQELLETLKGKYRLFIASNGTAQVQDRRFEDSGILPYFEDVFVSERVGHNKPAKEFFDCSCSCIYGFLPENSIIVGDSLSSDIRGGCNAGIRTCWYNPKGQPGRDDVKPDHEIRELLELPALLERIF